MSYAAIAVSAALLFGAVLALAPVVIAGWLGRERTRPLFGESRWKLNYDKAERWFELLDFGTAGERFIVGAILGVLLTVLWLWRYHRTRRPDPLP